MKKRKIKLLASLTSLVLVVAVMAVGVWAATKATVNITGNVSYTANGNVKATITLDQTLNGTALGAQQTDEFEGNEISSASTKTLKLGNDGTVTLSQKEDDPSADIVYTYKVIITNNAATTESKPNLTVAFDGVASVNAEAPTKISYTYETTATETTGWTDSVSDQATITIAPGKTATIVFTLTQSANNSLTKDIGAAITLTAAA